MTGKTPWKIGPDPFANPDVPVQTPDEVFASNEGDAHMRFNSTWRERESTADHDIAYRDFLHKRRVLRPGGWVGYLSPAQFSALPQQGNPGSEITGTGSTGDSGGGTDGGAGGGDGGGGGAGV